MNILICDDIPEETDKLKALLSEAGNHPIAFNCGEDVLEYISEGGSADVCILDIVMPKMSGVKLAGHLRRMNWDGRIVFLSTSKEYGPESYQVQAFDYLLKPPTAESVEVMLQKLEDAGKSTDTKGLMLKTGGTVRSVLFRDIAYVEAMQHNVIYHLADGREVEIYATFANAAEEILKESRFIRCHRSFIVNMDKIVSITRSEITMQDKQIIPVSRLYADAKRRYFDRGLTGGKQP